MFNDLRPSGLRCGTRVVGQTLCASTHSFHALERLREVWAAWRALFFFLVKKKPGPNPFVSAETLIVCALIGLHLLAADYQAGSSGSQSPDLGDAWKYGCPKSPDWEGDVELGTGSEGTSSSEQCEHNVERCAECYGARPVR